MDLIRYNDDNILTDYDIESVIKDICIQEDIKDLRKENQQIFKYILSCINKRFFNNNELLQPNNIFLNIDYVSILCDYYLSLCTKYNKLPSIDGFTILLGVDITTIELWQAYEPNTKNFRVWEKLYRRREQTLKDKCYDSNQILGTLSLGNQEYLWSMPHVTKEIKIQSISADALPSLSTMGGHKEIAINEES